MDTFAKLMQLNPDVTILDLGGTPDIWCNLELKINVTMLNLPEIVDEWDPESLRDFKVVKGDACSADMFADDSFDLVFSNSVIEHLPIHRQEDFAETVKRLAPAWWIQTPSISFPIEAHCNLPFWWFYPCWVKKWWIVSWKRRRKLFTANQMETTSVLTKERLAELFDGCDIFIETFFGFEKSYSVYQKKNHL